MGDDTTGTNKCPTKLLSDDPALEDAFSTERDLGPHKRVAGAIARLVRDEDGGRMIGLVGAWGSGKTTVINFIEKELSKENGRPEGPDFAMFRFDAWAHQGDPLRRSFLERLIEHLDGLPNWFDDDGKKFLGQKKQEVGKRRVTTTTKATSGTTKLAKWLGLATLLVPIGVAILDKTPAEFVFAPGRPVSLLSIIGLLLVTAPMIVLALKQICIWIKEMGGEPPISLCKTSSEEDKDPWAILSGKSEREEISDSLESPDPTSVEFEETFNEVLEKGLTPDRKLVIVIDNLDRVDAEDALSIWSTLQTFFQYAATNKKEWRKRLWFIVCYDATGINRLWNSTRSDCNGIGASFLDKSFSVRFEVPPLVLEHWRAYLEARLKEALPKHTSEDALKIYQVIDAVPGHTQPSPRELKLIVNQIGVVHRQWQDDFPLEHVAHYVSLRRQGTPEVEFRRKLIEGKEIPDPHVVGLLGYKLELQKSLAGLYFNRPANEGYQLLLSGPLIEALKLNKSIELSELLAVHGEGFWAVLDQIAAKEMYQFSPVDVSNAVQCVENCYLIESELRGRLDGIKAALCKAAISRTSSWPALDQTFSASLPILCHWRGQLAYSQEILGRVRESLTFTKEPRAVVAGLVSLLHTLLDLGQLHAVKEPFVLPVKELPVWFSICRDQLFELGEGVWRHFAPAMTASEFEEALKPVIQSGGYVKDDLKAVKVSGVSIPGLTFSKVPNFVMERANANSNSNVQEVGALLELLWWLRSRQLDSAGAVLTQLVNAGHVHHHFVADSDEYTRAWCVTAILDISPGVAVSNSVGNSATGQTQLSTLLQQGDQELAKDIVKILHEYDRLKVLFAVVTEPGYVKFATGCLGIVVDEGDSKSLFTAAEVIERWRDLKGNWDEGRWKKLVALACAERGLIEKIMEAAFDPSQAELYLAVFESDGGGRLRAWCKQELEPLDQVAWSSVLSDRSVVELCVACEPTLSATFAEAVASYAKEIATGARALDDSISANLSELLKRIADRGAKGIVRRRILDFLSDSPSDFKPEFWRLFGPAIVDRAALLDTARLIDNVFVPIVKGLSAAGLEWLLIVSEGIRDLLAEHPDHPGVGAFQGVVAEKLRSDSGNELVKLKKIADNFGIEVSEQRPED